MWIQAILSHIKNLSVFSKDIKTKLNKKTFKELEELLYLILK